MATRMQQRRGTAAQWTSSNPILNAGEIGFESDTNKFKIGDGINHWADLVYFTDINSINAAISNLVDGAPGLLDTLNEIAAAINDDPNFFQTVATLDQNGVLTQSQIPDGYITNKINTKIAEVVGAAPATLDTLNEIAAAINNDATFFDSVSTVVQLKAPKESPTFTGTVTIPTPDISDNSTKAASTAFVTNKVNALDSSIQSSLNTITGDVSNAQDAITALETSSSNLSTSVTSLQTTTQTLTDDLGALDTRVSTAETNITSLQTDASSATAHIAASTNVHGIADTSLLATKAYADSAQSNAEAAASNALSAHEADTTNIHGIADTSILVTTTGTQTLTNKTIQSPVIETQASGSFGSVTANATFADYDGNNAGYIAISTSFLSSISSDSNWYVGKTLVITNAGGRNGSYPVTSVAVVGGQFQFRSSTAIGGIETVIGLSLDVQGQVTKTISSTELGYLDGVTSSIQTQINAKAPLASPTFTGTLNAADVTISGNLNVTGTTTTVNSANLNVTDPMIYMGDGNTGNSVDLGFVSAFNDGTYQHSGLVRDASEGKWKLFKGVTDEPTTTVNFAQASLDALAIGALEASSATIGNVSNTELQYLDGVTSAIQTQLNAKAPSASPTLTGTVNLPVESSVLLDGVALSTKLDAKLNKVSTISQQSAGYTVASSDVTNVIEMSGGGTLTIPSDNSFWPVGTTIDVIQTGSSQVTLAGDSGVTVNATPGLKLRAQWSSVTILKRANNVFVAMGDLSA